MDQQFPVASQGAPPQASATESQTGGNQQSSFSAGSFPPAQWILGIQWNFTQIFEPGFGWVTGFYVNFVYPGTPAVGRLEPGDFITRFNGIPVTSVADFGTHVAHSPTGTLSLRVKDVNFGNYVNVPAFPLMPASGPGPGPGPGPNSGP